jgi:hypothetical protein
MPAVTALTTAACVPASSPDLSSSSKILSTFIEVPS